MDFFPFITDVGCKKYHMIKIYIDTNIFLDFYQSATDSLSVFKIIEKHSDNILLTEQTINEFRRNKNLRLSDLAKNIKKTTSINIHTTALVKSLPEFKAWNKAKTEAEKQAKDIGIKLLKLVKDSSSDPVFCIFQKLVEESKPYSTNKELIGKAQTRKLLGDPPTSPDKYTIGDELIWETILANCKDDLIIVSRDKTFIANESLLKSEFESITESKLVLITTSLNDAFKKIGAHSDTVVKAEKEIKDTKSEHIFPFPLTLSTKCPSCKGVLEETGYEGGDGDSAWWVYCTNCGSEFFPDQFSK